MAFSDWPAQEGRAGYVVLNSSMSTEVALRHDEYLVLRQCPFCQQDCRVIVPAQGLWDWEHGKFVQDAFPTFDANHRETLITGIHPGCWDDAFPGEED